MPRPKLLLQSEFPYHVTGRCINKEWFNIPMDVVWHIMSDQLFYCVAAFNIQIHAFTLMQNHFHLMIRTPEANLDKAMQSFMGDTSRRLTAAGNRINQTYGSRYFRCVIGSPHYYLHAYKYIYRNPVEAGLCKMVEEYPYSTLRGLLGQNHLFIPVLPDETLFSDVEGTLAWLNNSPTSQDWKDVENAMRRSKFRLRRSNCGKPNRLENDAL